MYLKAIEIHGFKSFANKITFNFHNGITGIVGPNGSGKSNVADAVRWVLGEQSAKQLRGSSMQDVIFSGTEMRKPMGYAYVSITLDNSDHALDIDFEEVTVARRVYRSGESEYLINGAPCRLKDVTEMFYDTGIGKEGYSIIGQGQIDKILSGKPEERRELFDEAAGIVKFKRRKDAAIKKLENERANLVRLNDILSELEKRVEPLREQSEIAKDYLKKKEDLKNLDVNMFLLESERINGQLSELSKKYEIADNDLKDAREKQEDLKDEYSEIEARISELDSKIESKKQQLSDNGILREKLEGEIKVLEEKINSSKSNREHFAERNKALDADIEKRNKEHKELAADKEKIDTELSELVKTRDEAKEKLLDIQKRISELTESAENGKNEIIELLNQRAAIKTRLSESDVMLSQLNIRKAEIQGRLLKAKSEEADQDNIIKKLSDELEAINIEIAGSDDKMKSLDEELASYRKALEEKDDLLGSMQAKFHQESSKLEALKNLTERYEGYGGSVKRVMEKKGSDKGLIGVVADIISVDKKYETAIETALGGNIQNVVTKDEQVARKMIAYLKENKGGRVTFLPLTTVKSRGEYKKPEVRDEAGFLGIASELVKADSKYDDVVSQLLGEIVVIDNIDNALKIARKYSYMLRLVTLEGEYLTPGGALAGGSYKNNSNLLGRRREIEETEKAVKEAKEKIDEITSDIELTKEKRTGVRNAIEELKNIIQEQYIRQNTARLNVNQAKERKEETRNGYSSLEKENSDIEARADELKKGKEDIDNELKLSEEREKELEEKIAASGRELDKLRDEESEQILSTSDLDLKVSNLNQKQEFARQNLSRVDAEIESLNTEKTQICMRLDQETADENEKQHEIDEIRKTIELSVSAKGSDEKALEDAKKEKEEFTRKQKDFFDEREQLSEKIASLDKEVFRLNSQREKLEESQGTLAGYMWNEYELTLSRAAEMRDESLNDVSHIRRQVSSLREAIRKLGDVNVNAIEEFKEVTGRYDFLKNQHDDIVKTEEQLTSIIEELDSSMRKQFSEKFADIGKEFDKVFKEMFGGGKGTLELQEDEDILEAGIRIIAQPPGKKLQNMMQLSGGEKSLTAIALLFAIQNLKPSPFCLLDEIEAALDESNVGRFAGYLHKLTKHTQFIVITHRRGTMEKADRLYGITMQEKGVSVLVSVNLIDKDLDD